MVRKIYLYESTGFDPYRNLALEKVLLDRVEPDSCILYLWQNQNTVVIGRNQNALVECRTSLLEQEGGRLARRLSGGGAVFHDLGNLNFTFLTNKEDYNVDRQLSVIQAACALAGISTEKSGRNDLLADGKKFSGNAFYQDKLHAYHHGTLMLDVDKEKLGRYLSPSKAKLEAKGVQSVRSRVVNLTELAPSLTVAQMKENMVSAFADIYGCPVLPLTLTAEELDKVQLLQKEYGSWDHLFGSPLPFTLECEGRFPWGGITIRLQAKKGKVTGCQVFTDAMEWQLPQSLENALVGQRLCKEEILPALEKLPYSQDLKSLFNDMDL